jgi:hypothetical protein
MRIAYVLPDPVDPGGDPCGHLSIHSDKVTFVSFLTILLGDDSVRAGAVVERFTPIGACDSCDVTGEASEMDGGSGLDGLVISMTDDDVGTAAAPPNDAVEPVIDLGGIVGCDQWCVPLSILLLTWGSDVGSVS